MQYSRIQGYDQGMLYFLNEASDVLFASLTLEDELIFDRISGLIVPHLADWFAIDVLDATEGIKLLTLAHKDKDKVKWGYELRRSYPTDLSAETGVAGVLRSGKPEMYQEITDEMLQMSARDPKHLEIMRSIGFKSVIIAPLKTRNLTFGAITFVATKDSERIYTTEDLTLIENFANKVAIAIDNSRLYKVAQQEITKSKLIEEEVIRLLEESKVKQEWLDSLLRTTPGIVWETKLNEDGSQQMTFVSKYAEEMLGYKREEMFSVNFWRSIIHPDDTPKILPNRNESYQRGTSQHQYRLIRKDGTVIWAEARSQVLYNESGQARGMRGVTFDITRMKELERRKDEFISIASHELKTPITSAKLIVQILTDYSAELSEETRYFTKKLDRQLDSLTFLINSMLDVNQLTGPAESIFKDEPFDLNLLIEEVVGSQREVNANEFTIEGRMQGRINCDRERLKQVLVILINNAVKYSEKGLPVKISVQTTPDSVQVSVQDKGVGIKSEYHQKIFDRFFRVSDPSIKYISGMGIGLNIAQQVIGGYAGKIWVESTPGTGSTFYFSLPNSLLTD